LERSNAQPVEQMISLTTVMRAYEANQRAISLQDEATGRLVRAAGPSGI
jgi:flagellar basal body rod protein FlgG